MGPQTEPRRPRGQICHRLLMHSLPAKDGFYRCPLATYLTMGNINSGPQLSQMLSPHKRILLFQQQTYITKHCSQLLLLHFEFCRFTKSEHSYSPVSHLRFCLLASDPAVFIPYPVLPCLNLAAGVLRTRPVSGMPTWPSSASSV